MSHFRISLNIVLSNGYSDYYLRHASRLVLASGAYRPKFRDYYREAMRTPEGDEAEPEGPAPW